LDANANVARDNISNLSRNYTDFITDYKCPSDSDIAQANIQNNPKVENKIGINSKFQKYSNPYALNKENPTGNKEPWNNHVTPKIQLNQVVYDNQYNSYIKHESSLDNILSKTKKYQQMVDKTDDYSPDCNYLKLELPNKNQSSCPISDYLNDDSYTENNGAMKNVNVENYIKYGIPTSKAKSLGFENPAEHYFSYIDDDIQNPDHICFDRPQLTRMANRKSFKSNGDY